MASLINENKKRILIIGDGFSLDLFDPKEINLSNDIVITCNNAITKVPKSDFHIIYNLETVLEKKNLPYLGLSTVLLCPYRMSSKTTHDFYGIKKIEITDFFNFLKYEPNFIKVFIDKKTAKLIFEDPSRISRNICLENTYFAAIGSGPLAFCIALHLNNMIGGIKEICYVGFDFITHRENETRFNFTDVKNQWKYRVDKDKYYHYQLALVTLLSCFDINFYGKLRSKSGLNIENDFNYNYKKNIEKEFLNSFSDDDFLTDEQMNIFYEYINKGFLDSFGSFYENHIEELILNNLKEMDILMRNGCCPEEINRFKFFPSPYIFVKEKN
jgi:hypothetical protein